MRGIPWKGMSWKAGSQEAVEVALSSERKSQSQLQFFKVSQSRDKVLPTMKSFFLASEGSRSQRAPSTPQAILPLKHLSILREVQESYLDVNIGAKAKSPEKCIVAI